MEQEFENNEWMKGIRETGFTVPANYFDELGERINTRVITEKFRAAAPADGFAVPDGYFKKLEASILAKTTKEIETAVDVLPASVEPDTGRAASRPKIVRLWNSGFLKYATAACLLIVAGAGLYFNLQSPSQNTASADLSTEQMLFDIDEQVIIEQVQRNDMAQPKSTVSDADLERYILNNYSQNELITSL